MKKQESTFIDFLWGLVIFMGIAFVCCLIDSPPTEEELRVRKVVEDFHKALAEDKKKQEAAIEKARQSRGQSSR